MYLLTTRKSPTRNVASIDPDGIWNGSKINERTRNTTDNTGKSEEINSEPSEIGSIFAFSSSVNVLPERCSARAI